MRNRFYAATLSLVLWAGVAAAPASATIIFLPGNNPQTDEENILFNDNDGPALDIFGDTNQSNLTS